MDPLKPNNNLNIRDLRVRRGFPLYIRLLAISRPAVAVIQKRLYFRLPIVRLEYFDLHPTPPINKHFDLATDTAVADK